MFDKDNILSSPRAVAQDAECLGAAAACAGRPAQGALDQTARLLTLVCAALVVLAGGHHLGLGLPEQKTHPGFWHVSLVSLLFWICITQGMVALSALLRLTHASWRYPLNRLLDMASLFGLWVPLLLPLLVLARHRIYGLGVSDYQDNVWRVSGPLAWDNLAVGTAYLAGWMLLYLTSLPDFAMLRDRAPEGSKEKRFYRRGGLVLARLGASVARAAAGGRSAGRRHPRDVCRLADGLGWDFQLAAARNWDSSIFAPLYTLGSLLGAVALASWS